MAGKRHAVGIEDKVYHTKPIHITTLKNWEKLFDVEAILDSDRWIEIWESNQYIEIVSPRAWQFMSELYQASQLTTPLVYKEGGARSDKSFSSLIRVSHYSELSYDKPPIVGMTHKQSEAYKLDVQQYTQMHSVMDLYVLGLMTLMPLMIDSRGPFHKITWYPTIPGMVMFSRLMGVKLLEET